MSASFSLLANNNHHHCVPECFDQFIVLMVPCLSYSESLYVCTEHTQSRWTHIDHMDDYQRRYSIWVEERGAWFVQHPDRVRTIWWLWMSDCCLVCVCVCVIELWFFIAFSFHIINYFKSFINYFKNYMCWFYRLIFRGLWIICRTFYIDLFELVHSILC